MISHSIDLSSSVNYGTAINLDFDTKLRCYDQDENDDVLDEAVDKIEQESNTNSDGDLDICDLDVSCNDNIV